MSHEHQHKDYHHYIPEKVGLSKLSTTLSIREITK